MQPKKLRLLAAGYKVANVDTIVFAQQPKLTPFKEQIRQRIVTPHRRHEVMLQTLGNQDSGDRHGGITVSHES